MLDFYNDWVGANRYKKHKIVLQCHKDKKFYVYARGNGSKIVLTSPIEQIRINAPFRCRNTLYPWFNNCNKCDIWYSKDMTFCIECNRRLRMSPRRCGDNVSRL